MPIRPDPQVGFTARSSAVPPLSAWSGESGSSIARTKPWYLRKNVLPSVTASSLRSRCLSGSRNEGPCRLSHLPCFSGKVVLPISIISVTSPKWSSTRYPLLKQDNFAFSITPSKFR